MTTFELTDRAVAQIKILKTKEPSPENAILRVRVIGGGCSGMSYKLGFESVSTHLGSHHGSQMTASGETAEVGVLAAPHADDQVFEKDGVQVVVDKKSLLFLKGTVLDFSDGLDGRGFEFSNPNAKRTCGCGSSFST